MVKRFMVLLFLVVGFAIDIGSKAIAFTVFPPEPRVITPSNNQTRIRVTCEKVDGIPILDSAPDGYIFDITGRKRDRMDVEDPNSMFNEGSAYITWTPDSDITSGVYIYQLDKGGYYYSGTLVVAK